MSSLASASSGTTLGNGRRKLPHRGRAEPDIELEYVGSRTHQRNGPCYDLRCRGFGAWVRDRLPSSQRRTAHRAGCLPPIPESSTSPSHETPGAARRRPSHDGCTAIARGSCASDRLTRPRTAGRSLGSELAPGIRYGIGSGRPGARGSIPGAGVDGCALRRLARAPRWHDEIRRVAATSQKWRPGQRVKVSSPAPAPRDWTAPDPSGRATELSVAGSSHASAMTADPNLTGMATIVPGDPREVANRLALFAPESTP